MEACLSRVARVARTAVTVIIQGETGTGKGVLARAIHARSPRADKPFVTANVAAVEQNFIDDELFGHKKGAFTGAVSDKPGKVALAEGGTLFLDEIGDLSPPLQVKLLRLLEENEYSPLGDERTYKADVRFIAATHRNLKQMVEDGDFRADLLFRLNVLDVHVPPLRKRPGDIEALVRYFAAKHGPECGWPDLRFTDEAMAILRGYRFPGNVRELENLVQRFAVVSERGVVDAPDVTKELPTEARSSPNDLADAMEEAMRDVRTRFVERALAQTAGNKSDAAALLGIARRTLFNWLEELDLRDGNVATRDDADG
jgi:transcriptional regulator with PAS, ATPase and Fis domain